MGRVDRTQTKLPFDAKKPKTKETEGARSTDFPADNSEEETGEVKQMFAAIQKSLLAMDGKIDSLVYRMDRMSERLDKHAERLDMSKRRVKEVEEAQTETDQVQKQMAKALVTLQDKTEDLEARCRRSNIRITGLPESTPLGNAEQFVEKLLISLLGRDTFSDIFIIERAHRSLGPRPAPGAPPRPVIAKLLNYRDQDSALRCAREMGELQYEGSAISLYLAFMMRVQEARRQFNTLK